MRWRTAVASTGIGCATASASAPRSSRPIRVRTTQRLTTMAARSHGLNRRASLTRATISLEAQTSKGEGCTGTSTRSAARIAERASAVTRGGDRKSVVSGKGVSVRVDLGGGGIIKKKKKQVRE